MGRAAKNFHHSSLAGKPSFTQMPKSESNTLPMGVPAPVNPVKKVLKKDVPSLPTGRKDLKRF